MKIRGVLAGQFSGSMAGITASHNRGGYYIRNRSSPVNPDSAAQLRARTVFATAVAAWSSLTPVQRALWRDAAAHQPWTDSFGESIILTGQQWFTGVQSAMATAGLVAEDVPPPPGTRPSVGNPDVAVENDGGDMAYGLTFTVAPGAAGDRVLVYITGPLGPGVETPPNRWTLVGAAPANTAQVDVTYAQGEGPDFPVGSRLGVAAQIVRANGQYSVRTVLGVHTVVSA